MKACIQYMIHFCFAIVPIDPKHQESQQERNEGDEPSCKAKPRVATVVQMVTGQQIGDDIECRQEAVEDQKL